MPLQIRRPFGLVAAVLATLLFTAAGETPSPPPGVTDGAAAAISQVLARNATLHDYTFDIDAHVATIGFPWLRFTLSGHGTYTKNGAYTVHFDKVPWFGHGFETISMSSLDPKTWPDDYTIALATPDPENNTVLALHDRKHTSLNQTLVTIDRDQTVRQILWNYANGGHVRLSIVPVAISGYALPQSENADISVRGVVSVHAVATATFSNYRVNQQVATSASPVPTATPASR